MTDVSPKKITGFWTGETSEFNLLGSLKNRDEQEKVFKEICSALTPALQSSLNNLTGLELTVEMTGLNLSSAPEALKSIDPENILICHVREDKLSLEGLFGFGKSLFGFVYNLMLGGLRAYEKQGQLTELEKIFYEKLNKALTESIFTPLRDKLKLQFKSGKLIEDAGDYQKIKWTFDTYHLTFVVKQENELGHITFVVPGDILKAVVLSPVGSEDNASNAESDADWMNGVVAAISEKEIPLNARLGHLALPLKNVLNLKENDVYPVIISEGGHTVFLNNKASYLSTIGTVNGLRAVQIIDTFEGESNG